MDGGALVGIFGKLCGELLHPVFSAAVHACPDGLPDGFGIVHFGGGAELNGFGVPSCGNGGGLDLRPDPGDIFGDGHG